MGTNDEVIESNAEAVLRAYADRLAADGDAGAAEIGILEPALALACFEAPVDSLDFYRTHLDMMAQHIRTASAGIDDAAGRAAVLADVVYGTFGYAGDSDTYDDLQNANIIRVIDRRKGLPVALGVLLIHLARAQGWEMWGLDFPGHFLLRLDGAMDRVILDPFHGGVILDPPALRALLKATLGTETELQARHYQQVSDLEVLLRLQNNIKIRLIKDRRIVEALGIVDTMLLLAPDHATLWREAGLMNAHLGKTRTAIDALETYSRKESRDAPRREVATLILELQAKLHN